MAARKQIPVRLLAILLVLEETHPGLVAALQKEFDLADLAEDCEREIGTALVATLGTWLHARTGNRSLGFDIGLRSPPHATGPLGAFVTACPSLGAALTELQAYYPLAAWDGSRLRTLPHARGVVVEIDGFALESIADVLVKDIVLGRLLMLARRLAGGETRPELIVYPESEFGLPAGIEACAPQIVRAKGRLALLFAAQDVARPAACPRAWLTRALKPKLDEELALLARADTLGSQVRHYLASLPTLADVSQAGVARRFNLSESTLKRRLAEEETSFSDLLLAYRRSRALELLTTTQDKLHVIAELLGFSERAAFERAFHGWFDLRPASYREQIRALGAQQSGADSFDPDKLPSSPRVCTQVLELLNRENYTLDELVQLVSLDPLLSTRIMAIACSAWYGARQVRDLADAIGKVLGVDQVRYLALISAANTRFSHDLPAGFDLHGYWRSSLVTAAFATQLHRHAAARIAAQPFELYLAALLLDIGRFMLAHLFPERMERFVAEAAGRRPGDAERRALEQRLFGTTSHAAGALLLAHWNLPKASFRIVREQDDIDAADASLEARLLHACAGFARDYYPLATDEALRVQFMDHVSLLTGVEVEAVARIVAAQDGRGAELEALVGQLLR
jgi:HD-like signal output (HDOD) protein/AraC-like DNA-binding protein